MEASINIRCTNGEMILNIVQLTGNSSNFNCVARTLTIRQNQVGLKPWNLMPCSKSLRQIGQVVFGEHQVWSACHSSVWFIPFRTSVKVSGIADLCLTLPKYCKTFDSPWHYRKSHTYVLPKYCKTFDSSEYHRKSHVYVLPKYCKTFDSA